MPVKLKLIIPQFNWNFI